METDSVQIKGNNFICGVMDLKLQSTSPFGKSRLFKRQQA